MHPAPTVCHRWRLARLPAPCSRSASLGPVHVQLHGLDSPIWFASHPLHIANKRLSAFVDVNVLNGYFLLSLATMPYRNATTMAAYVSRRGCNAGG
jgi:hypothetical protein